MILYLALIEKESDRAKFEQIYRKYRNCIYYFAYDILKNEQDAEDITQDCFLWIARNMEKFESVESKKTLSLLVLLSKHRAIDLYRKRRNLPALSLDECEPFAGQPDEHLSWVDENIPGILGKMNERYREVLVLRFCHGYSNPEIAKFMQISEPAARKLLQRARAQFSSLQLQE